MGSGWLSLIDHSIDVASVATALLRLWTVRARLAALAERPLSDRDVVRLCFFVGLHDAGKVNHGFQAKLRGDKPFAGHIGPLWAILGRPRHPLEAHRTIYRDLSRALIASRWQSWFHHDRDAEREMWGVILAHHGNLIEGMSRALLKLSGSLVHDYATISDDSPSPNRASRARRAATSAGIS